MKQKATEKHLLPPYVPYRTFYNFSMGLRAAIPQVIDRSVMRTIGGALQTQLLATLRFLNLIDGSNRTQPKYTQFISAEGDEQKKALRDILKGSYHFLFSPEDDFHLESCTPSQLSAKFQKAGAGGGTIAKCELFFLKAAQDAGIPLSPHILKKKSVNHDNGESAKANRVRSGRIRKQEPQLPASGPIVESLIQSTQSSYDQMLIVLLSKFPDFDPNWSDEAISIWHKNFNELMQRILDIRGKSNETGGD